MNVLLISQCSKNALTETRRILDQFAERRGDRTWQTPITQAGLETVRRLLRRSARKNTAVACHWIRARNHSELLWIVGDARQFNANGAVPTNTTRRNILRSADENDWHGAQDIRLLARLAALFHDIGKANDAFQKKLTSTTAMADAFRHEWVSLRLFEALVGEHCPNDGAWLKRLVALEGIETEHLARNVKDGEVNARAPFRTLRHPIARAVGWLIVSHHRLPTYVGPLPDLDRLEKLPRAILHDWCGSRDDDLKAQQACWTFSKGLPSESRHWREHVSKAAQAILDRPSLNDDAAAKTLTSPYVLHLSRLVLMLADHYYSAQPSQARYGDPVARKNKALYANSERNGEGKPKLKQRLDEHLIGVEVNAARLMHTLPRIDQSLPRIARHKGFRARSSGTFRWQNSAFDLAESLRERSAEQGFFGVNVASTGCGKTLANGRILYALASPQLGARFTVALGLRTLTLQTGDAYRERLTLGPDDLAVLVGGPATRALHQHHKGQAEATAAHGSESAADLIPEHSHVRYEGSLEDGPLRRWLYPPADAGGRRRRDAAALLDAPVLVCTIDHLMPATESTRGGHQILPMLRLMSSDLVLDEPDDFDIADLPALTRLVNWAGLLGSRVLLSSATLPPALVQGLFLAYCAGRREFQRFRGSAGERLAVCCAWFDEFGTTHGDHDDRSDSYLRAHGSFVDRRIALLAKEQAPCRRAQIVALNITPPAHNDQAALQAQICHDLAGTLREQALLLHRRHHTIDPTTGKRVSFGLVRMANIDPLFDVARALFAQGAAAGSRIHLCVYHARHPMLVRAAIERVLDETLKRHDALAVFANPLVRARLDASAEADHIFLVLATAVAEVGRDHDYDWAIVEPSSMRSIIQLAGRVQRHRCTPCPAGAPNIALLDTNIRHLRSGMGQPAFTRPGFETTAFPLRSHRLSELLTPEQYQVIDARTRMQARQPLDASGNLADLEHARLADLMIGAAPDQTQIKCPVNRWWTTAAHLTGVLQRHDPFRRDPRGSETYALIPNEEGDDITFSLLTDGPRGPATDQSNRLTRMDDGHLSTALGVAPWAVPDYLTELAALADDFAMSFGACARRFGTVDLPGRSEDATAWRYHPALGLTQNK